MEGARAARGAPEPGPRGWRQGWTFFRDILREFREDKCATLAAALAYHTLFSLAPLLVIVTAVAGFFTESEEVRAALREQFTRLLGAQGAETVDGLVAKAWHPRASRWATAFGVGTLILGATGVFANLQDSLNQVWNVRPKPRLGFLKMVRDRFLSFGLILAAGFLLLVSLVANAALAAFSAAVKGAWPAVSLGLLNLAEFALALVLNAALFGLLYKFLPDARIRWSDVRVGALVTAALFAAGQAGIGWYLGNSSVASVYGAAATVVILVVWVYYSALILFFGAEFTQVFAKQYGSGIRPAEYAVRVVRTEAETDRPKPPAEGEEGYSRKMPRA